MPFPSDNRFDAIVADLADQNTKLINPGTTMLSRMIEWQSDLVGSFYNYLPPGCRICLQGASLVLFVTGVCERSCSYCPLSEERAGRDVVFADEQPVAGMQDILEEAHSIGALGTGITGGEPLLKLDYVLSASRP